MTIIDIAALFVVAAILVNVGAHPTAFTSLANSAANLWGTSLSTVSGSSSQAA